MLSGVVNLNEAQTEKLSGKLDPVCYEVVPTNRLGGRKAGHIFLMFLQYVLDDQCPPLRAVSQWIFASSQVFSSWHSCCSWFPKSFDVGDMTTVVYRPETPNPSDLELVLPQRHYDWHRSHLTVISWMATARLPMMDLALALLLLQSSALYFFFRFKLFLNYSWE